MKILAYQGISLVSKAIRWQTRSPWSHIGILLSDGRTVEAWHKGGVVISANQRKNHTIGTKIAVFRIDFEFYEEKVEASLLSEVGKKYDFRSVFRFVSRRNAPADDRWFCSELAHAKLPFLLERVNSAHVSPRDLVMSPYLKLEREFVVR